MEAAEARAGHQREVGDVEALDHAGDRVASPEAGAGTRVGVSAAMRDVVGFIVPLLSCTRLGRRGPSPTTSCGSHDTTTFGSAGRERERGADRAYRNFNRYCAIVPRGIHPRDCSGYWPQPRARRPAVTWLRVFRRAYASRHGHGVSQQPRTRAVRSEKYMALMVAWHGNARDRRMFYPGVLEGFRLRMHMWAPPYCTR